MKISATTVLVLFASALAVTAAPAADDKKSEAAKPAIVSADTTAKGDSFSIQTYYTHQLAAHGGQGIALWTGGPATLRSDRELARLLDRQTLDSMWEMRGRNRLSNQQSLGSLGKA
ncbi:hypothetical protein DFH27DRAFT_607570 [Peziza echinospora]|nr:hypothetical protein DFH27DRAFT_607570 [Peziza echinospora]